jgi:hypothetical protein
MLVLALQFSKGDAQRRTCQNFGIDRTLRAEGRSTEPREEAGSSMPGAEGIQLPQNGREDDDQSIRARAEDGSYDTRSLLERPTSAQTG